MRFRIDFMPKVDHDPRRDADRQRWSPGTVIVQGQAEADRELQQHAADYGPELVFRATALSPVEEDLQDVCMTCGGDLRARLGEPEACECPVMRKARPRSNSTANAEEKAS